MPEVRPCPNCGGPMLVDSRTHADDQATSGSPGPASKGESAAEVDLPPVSLLAPGSRDDAYLNASSGSGITPAEPDPILGQFITPSSSSSASTVLEAKPPVLMGQAFPTIDLGSRTGIARVIRPSEADEDEPEGRRTSWSTILLASYASAISLGLAWTLWKDRQRAKAEAPPPRPTIVAAPEAARQAGLSRKVAPPEPILGEHLAAMGKPLRVGDLEVTPVDVRRQSITLERATPYATPNRKAGGKGALVLRLKLRNTSKDVVFSPLDQAYLRERGKEIVDTFLETASGERVYPYPLAIESEWSIADQGFQELRPGESRVVAIVSAPDAPPDSSGPFHWRVRLRTGINRTDTIGLRWPEK